MTHGGRVKSGRIAVMTALSLASVGAIFACSTPASPSSDLSRDLDAASSAPALTLAPTSGSRDVVSAAEQSPIARKAPAPSRPQAAPRARAVTPPPAQIATRAVAPPTATVAVAQPEPAPVLDNAAQSRRPMPVQQQHQGRYKTEAEVFRDAPFPITP